MAFTRRCRWRGIDVEVRQISLGEKVNFKEADFLFLGGGSDREQNLMAGDLAARNEQLREAIEEGLVALAICGGYQLMGKYYRTLDGKEIPGLGILDLYTKAGRERLIGNVAVEMEINGSTHKVVGFENHAGRTFLGDLKPLGRLLAGHGNNGEDGFEGARYNNVFCSYLHGPLLPKNTVLTDYLITLALKRRGWQDELQPLNDDFEITAVETMLKRIL